MVYDGKEDEGEDGNGDGGWFGEDGDSHDVVERVKEWRG